jgi:hypothetical protein
MLVSWVHGWVHGISPVLDASAGRKRVVRISTVASALANVVRDEADVSHGVTARELLALRPESARWITATALEKWLLDGGFAVLIDEHELVATPLAIEIAADLRFLG